MWARVWDLLAAAAASQDEGMDFSWRTTAAAQKAASSAAASAAPTVAAPADDDDDFDFEEGVQSKGGQQQHQQQAAAVLARAEFSAADSCIPSLEESSRAMGPGGGGGARVQAQVPHIRNLAHPQTPPRWQAVNSDVLVV